MDHDLFERDGGVPTETGYATPHNATLHHDLKWQPGSYGKGWVLDDGAVWTWPINEDRKPFHMDKNYVMKQRGLEPMRIRDEDGYVKENAAFEINPDGTVHRGYGIRDNGRVIPPEFMEPILAADPRLKNPDSDPWRFSNVIPTDRWAWKGDASSSA